MTIFPPGLPFLLGAGVILGIDVMQTATGLNVLCAALLVLLTYWLAERLLRSRVVAVAATVLVAISHGVITVFGMLWTEPLFTVIAMLVLVIITPSRGAGGVSV